MWINSNTFNPSDQLWGKAIQIALSFREDCDLHVNEQLSLTISSGGSMTSGSREG